MTEKQRFNYNLMLKTLKDIETTDSVDILRKHSLKMYGLDFDEALEMSYENIQEHAKNATRGIRFIKLK